MPTVIDGITGINRITGDADVGGNLDFVALGSRITGPSFSSSPSSTRFAFQTSQPNLGTIVAAIPNGTGGASYFRAMNNPDQGNSNYLDLRCTASFATIEASYEGTATPLPLSFYAGGTERMRIGVNGGLAISHTDPLLGLCSIKTTQNIPRFYAEGYGGSKGYALVCRAGSDDGPSILFLNAANVQNGMITHNATTTFYQTTSDYRLKENIRAMVAPLERLLRLKPVLFNWKIDGSEGEGFIAHQLQQEVPIAVSGEKDGAELQGVDASKVVPLLVAAVQELTLKVLALEARLS